MAVQINAPPPTIDHDTSSSAQSKSKASKLTKSELTPPSSPGDSHLPVEEQEQEKVRASPFATYTPPLHEGIYRLQQAVATSLFTASPELLASFIDPTVSSFKAVFKSDKQLVIWRKGNAVFMQIGVFENHTSMKAFGFEHLVGVAIGYDGSWRVIAGAGNAFCESKWPEVWAGKYRCFGGVNRMVVEYECMEVEKGRRADVLAAAILEGKFWTAKVDAKIT